MRKEVLEVIRCKLKAVCAINRGGGKVCYCLFIVYIVHRGD